MATLLKVLNNLADIKSAGVLHLASELRAAARRDFLVELRGFEPLTSAPARPSSPPTRPAAPVAASSSTRSTST
jgi:hypothetical protein